MSETYRKTHLKDEPKAIKELCKILPGNFVLKLINSKHTLYMQNDCYEFIFKGGGEEYERYFKEN